MTDEGGHRREPTQYLVARVREGLAHHDDVAALDLQIRIVDRELFLTGSVQSAARRETAEAAVRGLVTGYTIHNQLDVVPAPAPEGHEEIR
jgi:hypothetical protein